MKHESYHYYIGVLTNEAFKLKIINENFDNLTNEQIDNLINLNFNLVLQEHVDFERKYDIETNHMNNKEMQLVWKDKIDNMLKNYL